MIHRLRHFLGARIRPFRKRIRMHLEMLRILPLVSVCRQRYDITRKRLVNEARRRRIRVVFLVNESAKWKAQSLYNLLASSDRWEPIIARTVIKTDSLFSKEVVRSKANELLDFFEKRGMKCVDAADFNDCTPVPLKELNPDVVFYQQPWGLFPCQFPAEVSKYALTCYIPYYVQGFGDPDTECRLPFHRLLYHYYILNESWADAIQKCVTRAFFVPEIFGTGHTMLDQYQDISMEIPKNGPVIYAPHWSFSHPNHENTVNLSTFLRNGREILAYAQSHPSIQWAFRPHPSLRHKLSDTGAWSKQDVDEYFAAWEAIGEVSYAGDYVDLFRRSRAMVTDCGSFLAEYVMTGRPLIRLESHDRKLRAMIPGRKLFNGFYTVHNLDEMYHTFDQVILQGEDPLRDVRLQAAREAGLTGTCAAENILHILERTLEIVI